jgi:hypothetical protein
MEHFTIGLGNHWWVQAFGRSPLVRRSDRIEAIVLVLAVILIVVAIPIAGAIGTFVLDERTRAYAEEAHSRHQVLATATDEGMSSYERTMLNSAPKPHGMTPEEAKPIRTTTKTAGGITNHDAKRAHGAGP